MILEVIVVFLLGLVLGFSQSLAVGVRAGTWDGGTGCVWGLLVGVVSAVAAFWLGWKAAWVAVCFSILLLVSAFTQCRLKS